MPCIYASRHLSLCLAILSRPRCWPQRQDCASSPDSPMIPEFPILDSCAVASRENADPCRLWLTRIPAGFLTGLRQLPYKYTRFGSSRPKVNSAILTTFRGQFLSNVLCPLRCRLASKLPLPCIPPNTLVTSHPAAVSPRTARPLFSSRTRDATSYRSTALLSRKDKVN